MVRMLTDMRWCDLDSYGYLVISASDEKVSCQWWFVDQVLTISDDVTLGREVVLPAEPYGEEAVR
jgi:hypothetical protein